jgi:hypothetical protein
MSVVDINDPKGKIFCDGCQRMGKPIGGVRTQRRFNLINISYELPESWTLSKDASVLCDICSGAEESKPKRAPKAEKPMPMGTGRRIKKPSDQTQETATPDAMSNTGS